MNRHTLDGVDAFLRVAEKRSFSAAAAEMGVSPSAVSQTIRALEERIGTPLLMRTTRSVGLTQAGELFLERARPALDGLADAYEFARNLGGSPAGRLRLNLPRAVLSHLFEPILAGFCAAYPDIELEICAEDGYIDLVEGGFDAGVRLGEALDGDMVAVRLSDAFGFCVVGTPEYFELHGRPTKIADLMRHRCIRIRLASGNFMSWSFLDGNRQIEVKVSGPVIVNDYVAQMMAVQTGVGLAYMAEPNVEHLLAEGKLEKVLDAHTMSSTGLFLYYPSRKQAMPKLRAFIDYVRTHLDVATLTARQGA